MATGDLDDFVVFQNEFFGGANEILAQNAAIFNKASANCIRIVPQILRGQFDSESFFTEIASLVTRRDPTVTAAGTATLLAQAQHNNPKVDRRFQVENTEDSFRKIAQDPGLMSFLVGQQVGKGISVDYVNTGLTGLAAAIPVDATHEITKAAAGLLTAAELVQALALFGDQSAQIACWVMHSKVWFDLVEHQIGVPGTEIVNLSAGLIVNGGAPGTIGRPVVVTDDAALIITGAPDRYITMGITVDALRLVESEARSVLAERVGGLENIVARIQGELAFNVRVKGHSYSTAGANPDLTALGTAGNWSEVATDLKNTAGVRITTE